MIAFGQRTGSKRRLSAAVQRNHVVAARSAGRGLAAVEKRHRARGHRIPTAGHCRRKLDGLSGAVQRRIVVGSNGGGARHAGVERKGDAPAAVQTGRNARPAVGVKRPVAICRCIIEGLPEVICCCPKICLSIVGGTVRRVMDSGGDRRDTGIDRRRRRRSESERGLIIVGCFVASGRCCNIARRKLAGSIEKREGLIVHRAGAEAIVQKIQILPAGTWRNQQEWVVNVGGAVRIVQGNLYIGHR